MGEIVHVRPSVLFLLLIFPLPTHTPSAENCDFSFLAQGVPAGLFVIEAFVPAVVQQKKGKLKKKQSISEPMKCFHFPEYEV